MKTSKKVLSTFLALFMVVTMFSGSAFAADSANQLTGFGSDIASIGITGADVSSATLTTSASNNGNDNNMTYTYNVVLSATTSAEAAVTATFAKAAGSGCTISTVPRISNQPVPTIPVVQNNQSLTFSSTLSSGVGTATAYVFPALTTDFTRFDTYVFNFTTGAVKNPVTSNGVTLRFGDPAYANTAPECYMSLEADGAAFNAQYEGPLAGYYPDMLALYMTYDGAINATASDTGKVCFVTYDSNGEATEVGSITGTGNTFATVKIKAAGSISVNGITVNFSAPASPTTPAGSAPSSVVSYLPIGQYASGQGWGSAAGKFAGKNSLESTGVSLGALGGYIEFKFDDGITDDPTNPYGVDFVVYGNAFNGNPEAGAVQVSENGTTWYELAGSKYYDGGFSFDGNKATGGKYSNVYTGTLRDTTVNYTKGSDIQVTLGGNGPKTFTTATAWWPTVDEYADSVIAAAHQDSNVTVSRTANQLTFGGVTAVQDSNTTAEYAFGYADVTPNGSPATYGDAVNPYTPYTSGKTGGDGFDLAWAVDISTGQPVNVTGKVFKYVRVYSAVLDNATFGETSTEVCGIFTTANKASASVGTTAAPTSITVNNNSITPTSTVGNVVVYDVGGLTESDTISVTTAGTSNTYINSANSNSYEVSADDQMVRIIVQSGSSEPYIAIIK
ncbi:MAG: hypothetical protein ACLUJC_03245 [Clostridia bacterium]